MADTKLPAFTIKRIKEFSFLIDESLFELDRPVKIQFQHHTGFHPDKNLVDLTIRAYYSYDTSVPPSHMLIDFHVQNIFEIPNLIQYQLKDSTEVILPENLIVSLVSISISHLRALMAKNVAGTRYQDNIIPVVNPVEVATAFFPNMFTEHVTKKGADLSGLAKATQDLSKVLNNTKSTIREKKAAKNN